MEDRSRCKGGVQSQQSYVQQQVAASQQQFPAYQHQMQAQAQLHPYQYQQYQNQQQQQSKVPVMHQNRNIGYRNTTTATSSGAQKPSKTGAKMGIKSGMTVEDLKRLTQKRMQQSGLSNPATPKNVALDSFSSTRSATPKINMTVVKTTSTPANVATPPVVPKTGMSVQELKQLTALRVASQNAPVHASEITGFVSKAMLNNATKSHYRDNSRTSEISGNTPKRSYHARSNSGSQYGSAYYSSFGNNLSQSHGPLSSESKNDLSSIRGHRNRSHSSQPLDLDASDNEMPMRYSYTSGQTPEDYYASYKFGDDGGDPISSQETDSGHIALNHGAKLDQNGLLQFSEESFPPPPPMDDSGGFIAKALPSWSPPPARSKKLSAKTTSGATFYNQQTSYYNIASKDELGMASDGGANTSYAQDQNAVLAPPPGLTRRPSMTVPWQVAEAVLNTPQTNTGRKKLVESDANTNLVGLNSSAAEAAAQLTGLSLQSSTPTRGNSSALSSSSMSSSGTLSSSPSSSTTMQVGLSNAVRRGSFGNAAEFFKFRRRSKSRLELARDLTYGENGEPGGYPCYGTAGAMPGIAERQGDAEEEIHEDFVSDESLPTSANDESSSQDYTDEDVVQVTDGYDAMTETSSSFVSFINASRQQQNGLSALSILPPPPPPPATDDDEDASTSSSTKGNGFPMMSPNGARLRKVAELARQGSLSNEDKTRAKDEIIQNSLGIGKVLRLVTTKKEDRGDRVSPIAPLMTAPPGFHGVPRLTPKASTKKIAVPGSGIVRASSLNTFAGAATATAALNVGTVSLGSSAASLEERLATAAQRVAECVGNGDMVGFQKAMDELDWLRSEANKLMHG